MASSSESRVPRKLLQTKLIWNTSLGESNSPRQGPLAFHLPAVDTEVYPTERKPELQPDSLKFGTSHLGPAPADCNSEDVANNLSSTKSSARLASIASETKNLLPSILASLPASPAEGRLYTSMHALHQHRNPHHSKTSIRVLNSDTLDVAISMISNPSSNRPETPVINLKPPLLLNMANAYHGGGGWLSGALAQEEALCYRSSLSFTLKRRFYPIPDFSAIYSPSVVAIRSSISTGHRLLDLSKPLQLPVVSVVSVAALRMPVLAKTPTGEETYANDVDRLCMKEKMRVVLRVAGMHRHQRLVLGALGCGAFGNPSREVAKMWKEVLEEPEWHGWFEQIVFAVLDMGSSNWSIFDDELRGLQV